MNKIEEIINKTKSYCNLNLTEEEIISRSIREVYTQDDLRDIYNLFDITEYDLIQQIKKELKEGN